MHETVNDRRAGPPLQALEGGREMALTFKDVAEILKIIDASKCEEVVIELQGLRLVVRRGSPQGASAGALRSPAERVQPSQTSAVRLPSRSVRRSGGVEAELSVAEGRIPVRAPMVGSFYRRPSPQEKPFVEVGQRVKVGDPLCLIEVMKLYTTIPSPAAGQVEAITVEDGAAIEFDQLLFVIKPEPAI
jgi:acetyl-CoA carboxylase biotin carboxyl carrier protein